MAFVVVSVGKMIALGSRPHAYELALRWTFPYSCESLLIKAAFFSVASRSYTLAQMLIILLEMDCEEQFLCAAT